MRRTSWLAAAIALLSVVGAAAAAPPKSMLASRNGAGRHAEVIPLLQPYEAKLKSSGIPVYLPSWLPTANKFVSVTVRKGSYAVAVYVPSYKPPLSCVQCEIVNMQGLTFNAARPTGAFLVNSQTRPVLLHTGGGFTHGVWGYLQATPFTDHRDVLDFVNGPWPTMRDPLPSSYEYNNTRLDVGLQAFMRIMKSMVLVR